MLCWCIAPYAKNGSRFICESEISFNVYVAQPDLENYQDIESCGNYSLEEIVNQEGFSLGYYWQDGAQNPLTEEEYTFDEPGTYTVYVYAESEVNPDCFDEKSIDITIYERPQLYIEGGTICRDISTGEVISPFYLISGLDPAEFEVNWYLNNQLLHTGSEYEAVEAGEYYVEVEKVNPEVGSDCNYLPTKVTVLESAKPIVVPYLITGSSLKILFLVIFWPGKASDFSFIFKPVSNLSLLIFFKHMIMLSLSLSNKMSFDVFLNLVII